MNEGPWWLVHEASRRRPRPCTQVPRHQPLGPRSAEDGDLPHSCPSEVCEPTRGTARASSPASLGSSTNARYAQSPAQLLVRMTRNRIPNRPAQMQKAINVVARILHFRKGTGFYFPPLISGELANTETLKRGYTRTLTTKKWGGRAQAPRATLAPKEHLTSKNPAAVTNAKSQAPPKRATIKTSCSSSFVR